MISVIIPAGGESRRYSKTKPKLDELINGQTVLMHSVQQFSKLNEISEIIISTPKNSIEKYQKEIPKTQKKIMIVEGGKSRAESVFNGFLRISKPCQYVLIHDAARPNIKINLIRSVIKGLSDHPIVIPAIKLTDTIKETDNNIIVKTINRENLVAVQTPQGFDYKLLKDCYEKTTNRDSFTDEAGLMESIGIRGKIMSGDKNNIKLTIMT